MKGCRRDSVWTNAASVENCTKGGYCAFDLLLYGTVLFEPREDLAMISGAAIALSLSVLLCILRLRLDSQGVWSDAEWILIFSIWAARGLLWDLIVAKLSILKGYPSAPACAIVTLLALRLAYGFYCLWGNKVKADKQPASHDGITAASFLKPFVFPSRTSHARFFPKKHSFSYSYLLVGVPIGWRGVLGAFLSVDEDNALRGATSGPGAWLSVRAADHLHRGYDHRGLKGKLESFLATQVRWLC